MKSLAEEIDEFRAALNAFDSGNLSGTVHPLIREAFDVVGRVVNAGEDLETLSQGMEQAVGAFIDKALENNPVIRRSAKSILPFAIPGLVKTASGYTGTAEEFIDEYVQPVLGRWEETIHSVRIALAG